jgi:hypothetical protein
MSERSMNVERFVWEANIKVSQKLAAIGKSVKPFPHELNELKQWKLAWKHCQSFVVLSKHQWHRDLGGAEDDVRSKITLRDIRPQAIGDRLPPFPQAGSVIGPSDLLACKNDGDYAMGTVLSTALSPQSTVRTTAPLTGAMCSAATPE